MPKKIALTPDQESLMRQLFSSVPRDIPQTRRRAKNSIKPIIAKLREAGVTLCEDSIRRRAVALGLIDLNGAKYVPSEKPQTWTRPCINCRCTKERPRNKYLCTRCSGVSCYD